MITIERDRKGEYEVTINGIKDYEKIKRGKKIELSKLEEEAKELGVIVNVDTFCEDGIYTTFLFEKCKEYMKLSTYNEDLITHSDRIERGLIDRMNMWELHIRVAELRKKN